MRKHLLKTGLMAMTAAISISSSIPVFASGETEIFGDGIEVQFGSGVSENDSDNSEVMGILSTKYRGTATELNVRSGPGTGYSSIGTLKKGAIIKVKSISNGWAKFTFAGQTAYVSADYLERV